MDTGFFFLSMSILASSTLILLFRAFSGWGVNTFQAIVLNYLVCVLTGFVLTGDSPFTSPFWEEDWLWFGLGLGLLFIAGFNIVARTVQVFGVTIGSVAQKMSLLLSVIFAILYFGEAVNTVKVLGLVLAFLAIILSNWPRQVQGLADKDSATKNIHLVALTFGLSGLIEIILQYVEKVVAPQAEDASFIIFAFGMGFVFGGLYWLGLRLQGGQRWEWKSLWAGIILGVPNFFSLYFLMRALGTAGWEASVVFPISNVGMIGLSAFVAYWLFRERLSPLNWLGAFLAMAAILLIGFSADIMAGFN